MLIDLIAGGVLVAALLGMAIIIIRKLPVLAAIDVAATASTAERKASLMEQRLRRKFLSWFQRAQVRSLPLVEQSKGFMSRAQKKLVDLQHEYKVRSIPVLLNRRQQHKLQSEVRATLDQAKLLLDDEEYGAAEERTLQAVRLEPRSVPAFELLAEIYLITKEYQHAREVYQYLLKLTGESDAIYEHLAEAELKSGHAAAAAEDLKKAVDLNETNLRYRLELAHVERQLGNWDRAFIQIQEASHLEPNHPKVLDELIEISLGCGKKEFAADAVKQIEISNPDNSKIPEWKERIAAL